MNPHTLEREAARADLCRFLSACYYEPGPEFAEERVFDSMLAAANLIDPDLAVRVQRLGEAYSSAGQRELVVDYTRLFLGPSQSLVAPYGSVWLDGRDSVMGPSTQSVLELYDEGGFEVDSEFHEPPDHIAVELEFLYLMLHLENEARRAGESAALAAAAGLKKRFLDGQLGLWVGPFTAAVRDGARSGFYRELAELTARFVGMEALRLEAMS